MSKMYAKNPTKIYMEKYIFGEHNYEHLRYVKMASGVVRVFNGTKEIERIIPESLINKETKRDWLLNI